MNAASETRHPFTNEFGVVCVALTLAIVALVASMMLWSSGVPQLATKAAWVPAVGLVASLFAMVSSVLFNRKHAHSLFAGAAIGSLPCCLWPLAIAIGM